MFGASLLGIRLTGSQSHNEDLARQKQAPIGFLAYAVSGEFVSAVDFAVIQSDIPKHFIERGSNFNVYG
jgi:hypothetical protein